MCRSHHLLLLLLLLETELLLVLLHQTVMILQLLQEVLLLRVQALLILLEVLQHLKLLSRQIERWKRRSGSFTGAFYFKTFGLRRPFGKGWTGKYTTSVTLLQLLLLLSPSHLLLLTRVHFSCYGQVPRVLD